MDWLVNVYNPLCNCRNFHCSDNLLLNFIWDFPLDFDVLWYFYDFLDDSLRARDRSKHLNDDFHRFLYNHFLNDLFWNNTFVSINLCIPVLQKFSHHLELNFQLILLALKGIEFPFEIICFFLNILIVLQFELKPDSLGL